MPSRDAPSSKPLKRKSLKSTEPTLKTSENTERDIWESAGILISRHGELAAIEASKMADHYLGVGDMDMRRVWLRVVRAIVDMTDVEGRTMN